MFATAAYVVLLAATGSLFLWLGYSVFVDRMRGVPYPPGPKPIPFAGNVHQLPKTDFFKIYSSWAKIYGQILKFWRLDKEVILTTRPSTLFSLTHAGPIVYFYVFGRNFVVLSDLDMVQDLLGKRSSRYSTRPRMVSINPSQ